MVHSVYRPQTALPLCAGKRWQWTVLGEGGLRPPSQILALRVYNMPTMSTISRPRLPVVHSVYRPQTALPLCAGKRWQWTVLGEGGLRPPSQILALRVYNMPTVSTISRPRLPVVHSVYRPQTALPLCAGKRWQWTVLGEGGLRPPSQILALRVYNMPTVSTISRPRLPVVHSVYRPQTAHPLYAGKRWQRTVHIYTYICRTTQYDASYCVVLCRTVSYCVVLCRTMSYCVVLCCTVSYSVVQCRTVSYYVVPASYDTVRRVVQCRTVSYSVVQCRTSVVRHCTTRRTVSYKVLGPDASGMYDASYSVVQGVGARRVGDVRRVGRCRGPTRRKIPTSTVVHPSPSGPEGPVRALLPCAPLPRDSAMAMPPPSRAGRPRTQTIPPPPPRSTGRSPGPELPARHGNRPPPPPCALSRAPVHPPCTGRAGGRDGGGGGGGGHGAGPAAAVPLAPTPPPCPTRGGPPFLGGREGLVCTLPPPPPSFALQFSGRLRGGWGVGLRVPQRGPAGHDVPIAPPRVTFRRVAAPLRGPGQSPVLPFACCVGSLLSVGRCGRCSCWCRFRVCGAQQLACWGCAECGRVCRLRVSGAQ